ncbi:terminase small subunit [Megasphaera sueciensis]|uniref:terminase small subunit n=1 Tax=Megasphaera sueciensis TaxID=349094 RepID=UPI003CFE5070
MNNIRDQAYQDFCNGLKYIEIADKYHISANTVRSWASRYWNVATKKKKLQPTIKKDATKKKKIKDKLLDSVEGNENLTEKRRLFCLHYVTSHNAFQSYLKVYHCDKTTAMNNGPALLRNTYVKDEVKHLRIILRAEIDIELPDLLKYCLKVIGADIGDYIKVSRGKAKLQNSSECDTTLIEEIKQGKSGISIKLADKKWAWEQLAKYLDWQSPTSKEEQQARIAKMQAETKSIAVVENSKKPDLTPYLNALSGVMKEAWNNDEPEK